jgi:hypothetical protein
MKHFILPSSVVILTTTLTTLCCHMSGMLRHDLFIAAAVSGIVSAVAAFGVFAAAKSPLK